MRKYWALLAVLLLAGCGKKEVDLSLLGSWRSDENEEHKAHLVFFESGQYSVFYEFGERSFTEQTTNPNGSPLTKHTMYSLSGEGHGIYHVEGKKIILEPIVGACEGEEESVILIKKAHSKQVTLQRVSGSKPQGSWIPEEFTIANPKGGTFVVRKTAEAKGRHYLEDTNHWDTMKRKPGETQGR